MDEDPEEDEIYDPESLTFDELVAQLRRWAGQTIGVTVQPPPAKRGNTTLFVRGLLSFEEDIEVGVVDPRGGRIEACRVGTGQVQMLEGDFAMAEALDWGDGNLSVSADFREISLNFTGPILAE